MALIKCEDCGRDVSDKAPACPNCGCPVPTPAAGAQPPPLPAGTTPLPSAWTTSATDAPRLETVSSPTPALTHKQGLSTAAKVGLALIGLILLVAILLPGGGSDPAPPPATAAADTATSTEVDAAQAAADAAVRAADEAAAALAAASQPATPTSSWTYEADSSDISGDPSYYAAVQSSNTFMLDFPYEGAQHGTLMLRKHARHGKDVLVSIREGQILCSTYDCGVTVRIDDEKPFKVVGTEPANNDSTTIFLPIYTRLMKRMPGAKRLRVELRLYQAPPQTLDFNIEGFEPAKFVPTSK